MTARRIRMGKKYVFEVEEIPSEQTDPVVFIEEDRYVNPVSEERLYRVVGIPSLIFTQEQLDRFTPLEEDHDQGDRM